MAAGEHRVSVPLTFGDLTLTNHRWLVGLFALALVPRLLILALNPSDLQFWEYEALATNVAAGAGYVIPRFGQLTLAFGDGNLYSFLAATVYTLAGHDPMRLAVVQAVIASLAPPLLFALGYRAFGDVRPAALGAGLAALHPGLLAYTTKLHPLGMDVLLMTMIVFWITPLRPTRRHGVLSGLVLGISAMSRPTFAVAGVLAMLVGTGRARRFATPVLVSLAVAGFVLAPWVARNWVVLGRPIFSSTSLEDIWKGNNPLASGSSYVADGRDIFDASPPQLRARFNQPNELALDDVFAHEIVEFVWERPATLFHSSARKFAYFWWMSPQAGTLYPGGWVRPYQLYALAVYATALVRRGHRAAAGRPARARAACDDRGNRAVARSGARPHIRGGAASMGVEPLLLLYSARGMLALLDGVPYLRALSRSAT